MAIDEKVTRDKPISDIGVRRLSFTLYDLGRNALDWRQCKTLKSKLMWLWYASQHPSRGRGKNRKGKPSINIQDMVKQWTEMVFHLTLSHDKKTIDEWEFKLNELMLPLLKCPVKELRAFYSQLILALKNDARIPFFVWRLFEVWGDTMLKDAPDEAVIVLKKEMAGRIAALVEPDVSPQLGEAIANALQWRDPSTLKKIEKGLKKGCKAKLVGKESCLFLQVDDEIVML